MKDNKVFNKVKKKTTCNFSMTKEASYSPFHGHQFHFAGTSFQGVEPWFSVCSNLVEETKKKMLR